MTRLSAWQIATLVSLIVVFQVVPAVVASQFSVRASPLWKTTVRPSVAPPPLVFSVVWPVLYLCAAGAMFFQAAMPSTASAGVRWSGAGIMGAMLVLSFAWTPVFVKGKAKAAAWMIVAMLMLGATGTVLAGATNIISAALWAPWLGWLVFALIMSAETAKNLSTKLPLLPPVPA